MKRFVISEDERRRILSMHESATKRQYLSEQGGGVDGTLTGPTGTGAFSDTSPYREFTPEQKAVFEEVYKAWKAGGPPSYYDEAKNVAYYYSGDKKTGPNDEFDAVQNSVIRILPNKPSVGANNRVNYPYYFLTQGIQGSMSGKPEYIPLQPNFNEAADVKNFDENLLSDYRTQNQISEDVIKKLLLASLNKVTDQGQRQQIVQAIKDNPSIGPKYKAIFAEA